MPLPSLHERVHHLEERADESEATIEHLGATVNDVRIGTAKLLKNLGVLMQAQGVEMVDLTEDGTDSIFDQERCMANGEGLLPAPPQLYQP